MKSLVQLALEEDIGAGDITSDACIPAHTQAKGVFIARETLVIAGLEVLPEVQQAFPGVGLHLIRGNGDRLNDGDQIATVQGPARALLALERVSLNFLQHLSGIATEARKYAEAVRGTDCQVLDTRKTTPGYRRLEKAAARAGGITNHRMGLFDAILIKNNHVTAAGGVRQALEKTGPGAEIEVRTIAELEEALACGASHLLLDNLSPKQAADWVGIVNRRAKVELSGGITLATVRAYAETGADYVSCGAITHSARAVDISFRLSL